MRYLYKALTFVQRNACIWLLFNLLFFNTWDDVLNLKLNFIWSVIIVKLIKNLLSVSMNISKIGKLRASWGTRVKYFTKHDTSPSTNRLIWTVYLFSSYQSFNWIIFVHLSNKVFLLILFHYNNKSSKSGNYSKASRDTFITICLNLFLPISLTWIASGKSWEVSLT